MDEYVPGALSALLSRQPIISSKKGKAKNTELNDENDFPTKKRKKSTEIVEEPTSKKKLKVRKNEEATTSALGLFSKYEATVPEVPVGKDTLDIKEKPKGKKKKRSLEDREEQRLNRKIKREPETEEQLGRTVFVGNAPLSATRRQIKQFFAKCGDVDCVRQRSLLHKTEKLTLKMMGTDKKLIKNLKCTTFYVRFKEEEAVKKAIELHGHILDGHHLQVKMANKKILDSYKTVFVGNVLFTATEDELIEHFSSTCGQVESVRIIRDKNSGLGKGFAYVAFEDPSCVAKALKLDGSEFEGRKLRISKVMKKKKRNLQPVAKRTKHSKVEKAVNQTNQNSNQLKKIHKFISMKRNIDSGDASEKKFKKPHGLMKKIKKRKNKKSKVKSLMT